MFLIARDGWKFIFVFTFIGIAIFFFALMVGPWTTIMFLVTLCFALVAGMFYFFRDPDREIPTGEDLILSPADGRVLEVMPVHGEGYGEGQVVRIFLAPWDVHVQRVPVSGRVIETNYKPGVFLDARSPRAAFMNESNSVIIESKQGRVLVRQIAGFLARRIVCWVDSDDMVEAGERLGLIRLGSQTDIFIPSDVKIEVKRDDRVLGGVTIIGRWPVVVSEVGEKQQSSVQAEVS